MRFYLAGSVFLFSLYLQGCSLVEVKQPDYQCPLGESCAPIEKVNQAAREKAGLDLFNVWYETDNKVSGKRGFSQFGSTVDTESFFYSDDEDEFVESENNEQHNTYREQTAKKRVLNKRKAFAEYWKQSDDSEGLLEPVWVPQKLYKIWVAPKILPNGKMVAGRYVMMVRKGYWTYGGKRYYHDGFSLNDVKKSGGEMFEPFDMSKIYRSFGTSINSHNLGVNQSSQAGNNGKQSKVFQKGVDMLKKK